MTQRTNQSYRPQPRWLGKPHADRRTSTAYGWAVAGEDENWDTAARAWAGVEPGEVEALLRVERAA